MFFIYVYLLTMCLLCVVLGRWPPVLRYVLMFFFSSERWHLFECDLSCTKKLSEPTCLFRTAGYVVNVHLYRYSKSLQSDSRSHKNSLLFFHYIDLMGWGDQFVGVKTRFWQVSGVWKYQGHKADFTPADVQGSEEHTSELQSHSDLVCRLLLEKKKKQKTFY